MTEFYKNGFMIVRGIISTEEVILLSSHLKKRETTPEPAFTGSLEGGKKDRGDIGHKWMEGDIQAPLSTSFYADSEMNKLQLNLLPIIEKHTGLELYKTYNYARIYKKNSILKIHRDREACEISITLDLGGDKWNIWVLDRDENPVKIELNPGDAVIYRGCEIHHWRGKFHGEEHTQVFSHYVDKFGPYAWAKDDIKKQP